ncbi:hypothetical protein [Laceyella putida]|uniref:Cardiolipin synthase N-terminal domain-containing protein n=1 Tax=Laceyella putida TaxID=110101 RepID=A0ABW2RJK3_9BACL
MADNEWVLFLLHCFLALFSGGVFFFFLYSMRKLSSPKEWTLPIWVALICAPILLAYSIFAIVFMLGEPLNN